MNELFIFFAVVLILGMVGWEIVEIGLEKKIKSLSLEKERNYSSKEYR
jgi:hypothetical protein